MVAQQQSSKKSGRTGGKSTRENILTTPEELEFVNDSLRRYQTSGGVLIILDDFWWNGMHGVVTFFVDTKFTSGNIVPLVAQGDK